MSYMCKLGRNNNRSMCQTHMDCTKLASMDLWTHGTTMNLAYGVRLQACALMRQLKKLELGGLSALEELRLRSVRSCRGWKA
jgi:hypothetical protein